MCSDLKGPVSEFYTQVHAVLMYGQQARLARMVSKCRIQSHMGMEKILGKRATGLGWNGVGKP